MKSSRSGLLLIEILMTILFFSIAGAVCLQIYAKAHMIDKATTNSNSADEWVQNISESYYGCEADMSRIAAIYKDNNILPDSDNRIMITFDSSWNRIDRSSKNAKASYVACLYEKEPQKYPSSGVMHNADIDIFVLSGTVSDPFSNSGEITDQISNTGIAAVIYSTSIKYYENAGKAQ